MISIQEAVSQIVVQAKFFGTETVPLDHAWNRVLAQDIVADRDYPPFNRSAMDGYAVQSADFTEKKLPFLRMAEKLLAGNVATQQVTSGSCIKIMTGAPVPEGADAVIRVEDTRQEGDHVYFSVSQVKPGQHIAPQAEDARKADCLMTKGQWINTPVMSALAVTGQAEIQVCALPQVAVVSTGNEVVSVRSPILPHQIRDSNSYVVKSFLKQYQISSVQAVHISDDKVALQEKLRPFLQKDILIVSGGVSKGDADYIPEVLATLGVQEIFHRVRIKPGAPLWFGVMPNGGVVFGLPGNPVSVQVACKIFVEPFLRACFGMPFVQPLQLPFLDTKAKRTPFDEFFPCKIVTTPQTTGLSPVRYNGSGDISATLTSDGIALHPEAVNELLPGTAVPFYFW